MGSKAQLGWDCAFSDHPDSWSMRWTKRSDGVMTRGNWHGMALGP